MFDLNPKIFLTEVLIMDDEMIAWFQKDNENNL